MYAGNTADSAPFWQGRRDNTTGATLGTSDVLSAGRFCLRYNCLRQSLGYACVCALTGWSAHHQEASGKEARESCRFVDLVRIASGGCGLALRSGLSLLSALLFVLSTALCQRSGTSQAGNDYERFPDYFWLVGVPGGK